MVSIAAAQPQLVKPITQIGYPSFVKHGAHKSVVISISNSGDATLEITQIQGSKSTQSGIDWLGVSVGSLKVLPLATETFEIILNKASVFNSPGTIINLSGEVYLKSNAPPPSDSVSIVIDRFLVCDTVVPVMWDTISTGCMRLTISNNGQMGHMGIGGANLDFVALGGDCDESANVYLYDGGVVVNREIVSGSVYSWSNQLYQDGLTSDESFKPVVSTSSGHFGNSVYAGFSTGTFVNRDTTIGVRASYYAPNPGFDTCNFIIVKKQYFNLKPYPVNGVTVGEQIDWDVPSDAATINTSKVLGAKTVYMRGTDSGTVPDCGTQRDLARYAAVFLLGKYTKQEFGADNCANNRDQYGMRTYRNDTLGYYDTLTTNFEGKYFWNLMSTTGFHAQSGSLDSRGIYTYYRSRNFTIVDTVTVFTALITVKNGAESDLSRFCDKALDWYAHYVRSACFGCDDCCFCNSLDGRTGNVDGFLGQGVDISDLSALIDYLYISFSPPPCLLAANIDGDPNNGIDISDLAALIDFLYVSFTPPAFCH